MLDDSSSNSIGPEFVRCLSCGTIMAQWEDAEGFCLPCHRTGPSGDTNVPHSYVAMKLGLRNLDDAIAAQNVILLKKRIGSARIRKLLDALDELSGQNAGSG